jgi:hypothetical protein
MDERVGYLLEKDEIYNKESFIKNIFTKIYNNKKIIALVSLLAFIIIAVILGLIPVYLRKNGLN